MTRERVVDLPHGGEPPRLLGVEPLGLLDEALDLVHLLFVLVRHPSRQLGVVDAILLDRPVEAGLLELFVRLQLLPPPAAIGRWRGQQLAEGGLRLLGAVRLTGKTSA